MKIGLIDIDSHNFPNLPLMKISAWHKNQGDTVERYEPLNGCRNNTYDTVYISKIFDFTDDYLYPIYAKEIISGGTGYDLTSKLAPEIESIYPDYSLYPQYKEAYGFLTRGCPRQCKFCLVSEKEGSKSCKVADLITFGTDRRKSSCSTRIF